MMTYLWWATNYNSVSVLLIGDNFKRFFFVFLVSSKRRLIYHSNLQSRGHRLRETEVKVINRPRPKLSGWVGRRSHYLGFRWYWKFWNLIWIFLWIFRSEWIRWLWNDWWHGEPIEKTGKSCFTSEITTRTSISQTYVYTYFFAFRIAAAAAATGPATTFNGTHCSSIWWQLFVRPIDSCAWAREVITWTSTGTHTVRFRLWTI